MSNVLVIRLPHTELTPQTNVEWGLFNSLGEVQQLGQATLETVRAHVPQGPLLRILVLAPGEDILLTKVNIPTKQSSQLRQALPFMIEEQLAAEIEQTHIAVAPDREDDDIYVAVIDHSLLIQWLDIFYAVDLAPTRIISETLAVPAFPTGTRILLAPDKAYLRTGPYSGVCVDSANASHAIVMLANDLPEDRPCEIDVACSNQTQADSDVLDQLLAQIETDPHITVKRTDFRESTFEILATTAIREWDKQLNLLQGGYKLGSADAAASGGWWGVARVASVCLIAILIGYLLTGTWYDNRFNHYRNASIELYRSVFPQERRVISPKKQMASHLSQAQASGSSVEFMQLMQAAAARIGQFTSEKLQIQQAMYNEAGGQLKLQLSSNSLDVFERYRQSLAEAGFNTEVISARDTGDSISGQLLLGLQ